MCPRPHFAAGIAPSCSTSVVAGSKVQDDVPHFQIMSPSAPAAPPAPDACTRARNEQTHGPRSSRRNGDRSGAVASGDLRERTTPRPSTAACTGGPPRWYPARCWSATPTCRRSGHPQRCSPSSIPKPPGPAWLTSRRITLVADQRLVPLPQLLRRHSHDRLSIGRVLAGLVLVATDDVPPGPRTMRPP